MEKILDYLKNNRVVQGALVLGGVAASAYLVYQRVNESKQEENVLSLDERINQIIQNAQIQQYMQYQFYDLQTLMDFTDLFTEMAIPEFREMVFKFREERRELMHIDKQKYYKSIVDYNNEMLMIVGKQSQKLLKYEGYNDEYMRVAISIFMREPQYQQKIVYSLAKVKSSVASSDVTLSVEDAQSIIAFFIKYVQSQPEILVHLVKYIVQQNQNTGQVHPALKTALYDQLYLEKGFEEEDYLVVGLTDEFLNDPITQKIQRQYSETLTQFIQYHSE
ncbi:hypothetical protein TTHERM_00532870 (macronuclear) [Tetrahymena thermophila SB210]|uniref:Uncharacterized protein n=1 Tax=Tetrahymena thermophila (strain SB210) TaxID=312017 RepID=Q247Y2_TETTS|nr:hypothetical protein TTHERM_00532870 [Tetrahymena thermophila SB210]EAS04163.1 hypothetical protein TTHERM_00532870 [Tetrahymena thermophila SB210]|eukprot:XP_001024408.1 hypothetical protein TTHERM_00532870 [Tetrahymena thermophila SB210]